MVGLNDTHPDATRVQLDLLRKAGMARRAELMRSLSSTVIGLSRRALREQMPCATERELAIRWVELNYGAELAARVSAYLVARDP